MAGINFLYKRDTKGGSLPSSGLGKADPVTIPTQQDRYYLFLYRGGCFKTQFIQSSENLRIISGWTPISINDIISLLLNYYN